MGSCRSPRALNVARAKVNGMTAGLRSSAEFVRFLDHLVATQSKRRAMHIIVDNLATHNTKRVAAWLVDHPTVTLHFTPTYSSWLNQIELWFAKIDRDIIARGIFTSTADLWGKLMQYIRAHNKTCQPIPWSYSNTKHRIVAPRTSVTSHQFRSCGREAIAGTNECFIPVMATLGNVTD